MKLEGTLHSCDIYCHDGFKEPHDKSKTLLSDPPGVFSTIPTEYQYVNNYMGNPDYTIVGCQPQSGIIESLLVANNVNGKKIKDLDPDAKIIANTLTLSRDLVISTQEDLEALKNISKIEGNIIISGDAITNVTPLMNLQWITGDLQILKSEVTSIEPLNGLHTIGGRFRIYSCENLKTLPDFSSLRRAGSIELIYLRLESLNSFNKIKKIEHNLEIDCAFREPQELFAFNSLETVGGDFGLVGLRYDKPLASFLHLKKIFGNVQLANIYELKDFHCFRRLEYIGKELGVHSCDKLQSFSGFSSLQGVGSLNITTLRDLESITTLFQLRYCKKARFIIDSKHISHKEMARLKSYLKHLS